MRVSIVGTGYVGLVTGACLAEHGHEVVCVDVDPRKVEMINRGHAPFHERGLSDLLARNIGRRLRGSTDLAQAIAETELTLIAVGTPAMDGRIDLRHVADAAAEIGSALRHKPGYHTVVVKSTVIPGTTDGVVRQNLERMSGKRAGHEFGLGMNPEFLTEGRAVDDFLHPDRIVLGGIDHRTQDTLARLYASVDAAPRVRTNNRTAEMIKYASNAVLATLISFSNEIARLCAAVGEVDVVDVMNGVHQAAYFTSRLPDGRAVKASITSFLEAGCGFGGSCLPKDVTALIAHGAELGLRMPLLRSVLEINRGQPEELGRLIAHHYPDLRNVPVTVLGLAFKPDTDDVRESPAFPVIRWLREAGAAITAYDPVARPTDHEALHGVRLAATLREALSDAEIVILVTRWDQFQQVPAMLGESGRTPLVVDGRRALAPLHFTRYVGIGR